MESHGSRLVEFHHANGCAPQQPHLRFPARLNPPVYSPRRDAYLRRDRARRFAWLLAAALLFGIALGVGAIAALMIGDALNGLVRL